MLKTVLVVVCLAGAEMETANVDSYLVRVGQAIGAVRKDLPSMEAVADEAAARLAEGASLWAGGQASMVSELCGRAGGLMLIKRLGTNTPAANDVVLFARNTPAPLPKDLVDSGALIIVFGAPPVEGARAVFNNYAKENDLSPTLANAIPAWAFTAELVSALTRLGKMPVLYASIGTYEGYPRIYKYQKQGILWHEPHQVPPIDPGVLGRAYCDAVSGMLLRVETEERAKLDRAGAWAAEAKANGNRLIMYSMGHLFPAEVQDTAIGELFESAVWSSGFLQHAPPDHTYSEGDVLVQIGYQHPPYRLLERARPAGARVVYVDVMQHRDYTEDPEVIWIDPMWPWVDACVSVAGYDIAMLPPSGIVNGAIAWEIHRLTANRLAEGAGTSN